jgi:phosphoesterase RecJ-like protein
VSFGDDPLAVPRSLSFLPGLDLLVHPAEVPAAPEVVMVFDAASLDRLGLLVDKAKAAAALVVVDHHTSNTGFGTHHLVDVAAPATAVLVEDLIRRLGVKLTPEIATAIYAGLASDTGSFRYAGTTPATHALAARLLEAGVRHDVVSRRLWDTASFGYLKVLARALERAWIEPAAAGGLGVVWTVVTRADRDAFGVVMDEIEGVIDVVRKTSEAEVAVVLKEDTDGSYRVSARSKGRADVGAVCTALGGGGHRLAAGLTTTQDAGTTMSRILDLLGEAPRAGAEAGDGYGR